MPILETILGIDSMSMDLLEIIYPEICQYLRYTRRTCLHSACPEQTLINLSSCIKRGLQYLYKIKMLMAFYFNKFLGNSDKI